MQPDESRSTMCQCTSELRRPHPDYAGFYEVSTCGRVRSVDRVIIDSIGRVRRLKGRPLVPKMGTTGHWVVILSIADLPHTRAIHRLVLETFVGPRPAGMEGCHGPAGQLDNHLTNLRWDTRSENQLDRVRHGTHYWANKVACPLEHLLISPNIPQSKLAAGHRQCLACCRARDDQRTARRRGRPFDFLSAADRHYTRIMG